MKKQIKYLKEIFFLSFLFFLTLSCRQDEINPAELEKTKTTTALKVFESKDNNNAKSSSTRADAYAFRLLYFTYYIDHPEEAVDFKDLTRTHIDFGYSSQVFYDEDFTRKTLFPIIEDNQVKNVVVASVTNENDKVSFYIPEYNEEVETAIQAFSERRGSSDAPHLIEEVIITIPVKKNTYLAPFEPLIPGMPLPPTGDCSTYNNCGGGGGGATAPPASTPPPPPPPKTPVDIKKFLSCLNINQPANLTVYAEKMDLTNANVGHAFISITQGGNTMTFGFYPKYDLPQSITGPGIIGDDSGHDYTHLWNVGTISFTQLQQIIATSIAYSGYPYDVVFNNCADFTLHVLSYVGVSTNTSGFDTPDTVKAIIGGSPPNGNAPQTHRTCP